jgi:hypothetical protein
MDGGAALRLALDLLQEPWGVRLVRQRALPEGVVLLLNVAAGDEASEVAAADASGKPRETVKQAASFFIEQILLAPDADCYRVLGASPSATSTELRRNMALLMRWLHPDIAREGDQSVFAARIAEAWSKLKTPERRAAYDSERQTAAAAANRAAHRAAPGAGAQHARSRRSVAARGRRRGGLPRVLAFLLGKPRH